MTFIMSRGFRQFQMFSDLFEQFDEGGEALAGEGTKNRAVHLSGLGIQFLEQGQALLGDQDVDYTAIIGLPFPAHKSA